MCRAIRGYYTVRYFPAQYGLDFVGSNPLRPSANVRPSSTDRQSLYRAAKRLPAEKTASVTDLGSITSLGSLTGLASVTNSSGRLDAGMTKRSRGLTVDLFRL